MTSSCDIQGTKCMVPLRSNKAEAESRSSHSIVPLDKTVVVSFLPRTLSKTLQCPVIISIQPDSHK